MEKGRILIVCSFNKPCKFSKMVKPNHSKRGIYKACTWNSTCNQKKEASVEEYFNSVQK